MTACAAALVLLMDVSGSIGAADWRLQVDGHAEAIRAPAILRQVEAGGLAVTAVQFDHNARVVLPWRVLRTAQDAQDAAEAIRGMERTGAGMTATSAALEAAEAALDAAPCGDREVVDLVTDGPPNAGDDTEPVRQRLIARGAQVNGLSVGRDAADWMRESVVSPFWFALAVEDWAGFAAAMRRKLVMELTWSAR